jgi:hypothetical protein
MKGKSSVISIFSKEVAPISDGVFPLTFSFPLKIRGRGTQAGLGSGSYDYPSHEEIQFSIPLYQEGRVCVLNRHSRPASNGVNSSGNPVFNFRTAFRGINANRNSGINSFHHTRRLPNQGAAIIDTGASSLTFNYASTISIQTSQPSSNNLSGIFIPPKSIS